MMACGDRQVVQDTDGRPWALVREKARSTGVLACCLTAYLARHPETSDETLQQFEAAWAGHDDLTRTYDATGPDLRACVTVLRSYGLRARLRAGRSAALEEATVAPLVAALDAIVPGNDEPIAGGGHGVVVAGRTSSGTLICLDPRGALVEVSPSGFPAYTLDAPFYPFHRFRGSYVTVE